MIGLGLNTCREDRCRRNTFRSSSSIPRQLPLSPMRVLSIGIEHRSTLRCSARITPIQANIVGPPRATSIRACIAACHSEAALSTKKSPASRGQSGGRGKLSLCSTRISDSDREALVFKLGHCENQNRPQGVKTGQYQKLGFAVGPSGSGPASVAELKCFPQIMSCQIGDHPSAAFDRGQRVFRQANLASAPHPMGSLYRIWPRAPR
jgi:hypothetical protein